MPVPKTSLQASEDYSPMCLQCLIHFWPNSSSSITIRKWRQGRRNEIREEGGWMGELSRKQNQWWESEASWPHQGVLDKATAEELFWVGMLVVLGGKALSEVAPWSVDSAKVKACGKGTLWGQQAREWEKGFKWPYHCKMSPELNENGRRSLSSPEGSCHLQLLSEKYHLFSSGPSLVTEAGVLGIMHLFYNHLLLGSQGFHFKKGHTLYFLATSTHGHVSALPLHILQRRNHSCPRGSSFYVAGVRHRFKFLPSHLQSV